MAKQKNSAPPSYIQRIFTKAQYNIGDAVCFSWLGGRQYGIIVNIKTVSNEEISYTVSSYGTRYPCGIEVKEHRNRYHNAGFIQYNSGEDQDVISSRSADANSVVVKNGKRQNAHSIGKESAYGTALRESDNPVPGQHTGSKPPTIANSNQPSSKSANKTRNPRSNPKLDSAIQKQRNFLNGFIKKD
jgi:hypothetical protein